MSDFLKLCFRNPTRPDSLKISHYSAPAVIIFQPNQNRMEANLKHYTRRQILRKPKTKKLSRPMTKEVYLQGFRALNLLNTFQKHRILTEFGHRFQHFTKLKVPFQNLQLRDLVRTYFEARNPSRVVTRSRNQRKGPPLNRHPLQAYLWDLVRTDF